MPNPSTGQRLRIIHGIADQLRKKIRRPIALDNTTSFILSEQMDIDLREITRLVEDAFARAIQTGDTVAYVWRTHHIDLNQCRTTDQQTQRLLH